MPFTTGDFQSFDIQGRLVIEHGDADKLLLRINKASKSTKDELEHLQKQTLANAAAFKKLGDSFNQKSAVTLAKQIQATRDNLKNIAPADALRQIKDARTGIAGLNSELLKQQTFAAGNKGNPLLSALGIAGANPVIYAATAAVAGLMAITAQGAIESVKLAASFERTENSVRVYAGSLTAARNELKAVSDLSANTPGLRLESAEIGYQRLRAVSFEAANARGLLEGLAKEKILSGADNQAIERVIFNFGQLKVGAQKFSQEVREILTQMPSLRRTFLSAFGTLDPQKIQALFDTNPDAFFEKLSAEMSKTKGITSDTIDSFEKLQDEFIKAGRAFAKPLLPGITAELQNATAYLRENGKAWGEWGQFAADAAKGIKEDLTGLFSAFGRTEGKSYPVNDAITSYLRWATGISELGDYLSEAAEKGRDKTSPLVKEQQDKAKREADRIEEFKTQQANKEFDRITKEELQRNEALRILDSYHSSRISIIQNALTIESALVEANPVFNLEQEKASVKRQTDLRSDGLNAQLKFETAFYKERERLNAGNKLELEKVELEKGKALGKIQTDIIVNQIKGQQQIEKIDRQIVLQKREAIQELNRLSAQSVQQGLDVTSFNFDRATASGGFTAANTNQFRDALANSYAEQIRLSSEFHRAQLLDESLTAEQRTNILKRLNLEQTSLSEDLRRRLLKIGDRQYSAQLQQMEEFGRALADRYQSAAKFYGDIGQSFFSPATFGAGTAGNIDEILLRKTDIGKLSKNLTDAGREVETLNTAIKGVYGAVAEGGELTDKQREAVDKLSVSWLAAISKETAFREELEKLERTIPKVYYEFGRLAKQIGEGNTKAFDVAARTAINARHQFERASLQSEIDALRGTTAKDGTKERGLIDFAERPTKKIEYQLRLSQLLRVQESQRLQQANELTEQYSQSLDGLTARLERLRAGNKAEEVGFRYSAQQNILGEQIGQYGEIIELKERLAKTPLLSAQAVEIAQLSEIVRLQQEFQSAAAGRAIRGNRTVIYDRLQAGQEKEAEQTRLKAIRDAGLALAAGSKNETAERLRIQKEYHEASLKAENKYQEDLKNAGKPKATPNPVRDLAQAADINEGVFGYFGFQVKDAVDVYADNIDRMKSLTSSAFGDMTNALGESISAWIIYGDAVGGSMAKATAAILANLSAQAFSKAIWETAEGVAMLALNYFIPNPNFTKSAIAHFASAAIFAGIGGGSALLGRAIAPNQAGAGGGSANAGQPDYYTSAQQAAQNQSAIQMQNVGGVYQMPNQQITPQQVQNRTSERAEIAELKIVIRQLSDTIQKQGEAQIQAIDLNTEVTGEAFGRIKGMSPGTVLTVGAKEVPGLFGKETLQDLKTGRTSPTDFRKGLGTS